MDLGTLEYKPGIYQITNILNGKKYIGSSVKVRARINEHQVKLDKNIHVNKHLQNSWNKYGGNLFKATAVIYCEKPDPIEYEQFFMDKFRAVKNGYNIRLKAGSNIGHRVSGETKYRQSVAATGRRHTEATKKKLSIINLGRKRSPESTRKTAEANRGLKRSPEVRKLLSELATGRKHTEETKKKIGLIGKGRRHTSEAKQKISEASKEHWTSTEYIKKMRKRSADKSLAKRNSNNSSGYYGVYWGKRESKWIPTITVNKKRIYLGTFHDLDDAIQARRQAELKYYGRMAA